MRWFCFLMNDQETTVCNCTASRCFAVRPGSTRMEIRLTLQFFIVSLVLLLLPCVNCYTLLFFPLSEKTHMLVHLKLATALAKRNNTIYFMTVACHRGFAEKTAARMAPDHSLYFITHHTNCSRHEEEKKIYQNVNFPKTAYGILNNVFGRADEVLSDGQLVSELQQLAPSIDLMVGDILSYGMLLANKLGLQHVDLDVGTSGQLFEAVLQGAEPATSFIPALGTFFPTNGMSYWQRVINLAVTKATRGVVYLTYWHPDFWLQRLIKKHKINMQWPYVHYMMLLVNSNWITEPPRAVAPNTRYIGPILPEPAQELPQQLKAWVEGSGPKGTVFISFGGTLQAPLKASRTLMEVMRTMPDVRFVWKLAVEDQASLQPELQQAALANVLIHDWVPQNDLLGHPKVTAFVTQGGYLSMAEAAYHAVPILGLPFIPGQGEQISFARDQGRARMVPGDTLLKGNAALFKEALTDLISNKSYKQNAEVASHRLQSVKRPYIDTAAELVEYAAAVKEHAPFLHPHKLYQPWYQQVMLDVLCFYFVAAAIPAALLWRWILPLRWKLCASLLSRPAPVAVISLKSRDKLA